MIATDLERNNKLGSFLAGEIHIPKLALAKRTPDLDVAKLNIIRSGHTHTQAHARTYTHVRTFKFT